MSRKPVKIGQADIRSQAILPNLLRGVAAALKRAGKHINVSVIFSLSATYPKAHIQIDEGQLPYARGGRL